MSLDNPPQANVEQDSEGPHVRVGADGSSGDDLGREELGAAVLVQPGDDVGGDAVAHLLRAAQVDQLDAVLRSVQKNVLGLWHKQ